MLLLWTKPSAMLTKIFVDVPSVDDDSSEWVSVKAVIDTGATRSMVSQPFVQQACIPFHTDVCVSAVALDGNALNMLGTAHGVVRRLDI